MRTPTPAAAALFATVLACAAPSHAAPAAPAAQQSQSDLQKEVDRLRQENQQLKQQLADAADRLKKLEADKAAPPATPAAAPSAPATAPADTAPEVVPADPNLGPAGLLSALQANYLSNFSSAPAQPTNLKEQSEFTAHLKKLEVWANQANRDNIKTLTWIGRIDSSSMRPAGTKIALDLIFGSGNNTYRVPVTVTEAQLSRVRSGNLIDFGDLSVTALVRPKLRVDASRPAPGAFEARRMAAPYLLYAFDYDVKSIAPSGQPQGNGGK
jgi:hypothetical protein